MSAGEWPAGSWRAWLLLGAHWGPGPWDPGAAPDAIDGRHPHPPPPPPAACSVLDWIKALADDRGLSYQQDKYGNLVVRKPGCGGGEQAPAVIVQV